MHVKSLTVTIFGASTFDQIFSDGTMSVIATHPLKEPAEVRKVIARINNLGPDHFLKKNGR